MLIHRKTIKQQNKRKKHTKYKTYNRNKTKKIRGGENERLSKLKDLINLILNYCYFNKFISPNYKTKFEDIPENEQVVGEFGVKKTSKIIGQYNFGEYMENKLPELPRKNSNELIKTMNTSWNDFGNAYKLFPDNLFSDKYIFEIDKKIKKIVDELNNIKMNDEDNEDAEMNDEDNAENKHANLLEQIHIDLFMYLYVNNMNIEDIFLDNVIMPAITKIYNIKDIYDIDNE